ncbi:SAM-dependent methyltransferase [Agrobacterium rubi]|uniref:Class I SAM-dependent methyltransferase n=1 Tax=Agrobacterium rubi TaxID=28099 RepID=A0AAE7RBC0_9HYPH|nr:cyclopropane-fatty-acyl-phospholipid synthase family protein [Agrobacterium rubi]NTE85554.1 class I SAM-dependent methyltransferase [Agrobacterium rubi]NTF01486.1 class I SAM-dependent methyltransferase [Agrobacterium rubi]NTF35729.1 class I SAM-dependent methyltransferase [Agrobacterium rubi]OCJ48363.1 cyclopropane-fatty-acyl-phospholipid synthase [Agrobacterium rubi]QTG00844.1 class I SAM-dependent methyltransferase [Agrobacterium rubi]
MASSLHALLGKIIKTGNLVVTGPGGLQVFGDNTGKRVAINFTDQAAMDEIAADPALKLAEMFMEGRMVVVEGDIYDFLALIKSNTISEALTFGMIWRGMARIIASRIKMHLPVNHNKDNVAHHYDLSAKLFDLFLDEDWQYSCAYFNPPGISLYEAQVAKKRHITAKLMPEAGHRVLEIGSGWGGMAMYLAESSGVEVTGITLSEEQLRVSRDRAQKRGLDAKVRFELQDYRYMSAARPYDRIVSVGMFEHVGPTHYREYFTKAAELLDDDGVMLLHSIGQPQPALATNPFIEKYIFPGGYIPSLAEVLPAIEKSGLLVRDIEILPMHYAHTLRAWRERFVASKAEAIALYDERFFRMWEFYLAGSEMAFTHENFHIFQMQLTKRGGVVPVARDYIAKNEARLMEFEKTRPPLEKVTF